MSKLVGGITLGVFLTLTAVIFTPLTFTDIRAFAQYPAEFTNQETTPYQTDKPVKFTENQIDTLNDVNQRSLGLGAVADEKQYCFALNEDKEVTELYFVDSVKEDDSTSITGLCYEIDGEAPDGWLHTQPDLTRGLSETDKDLPDSAEMTCINWANIVVEDSRVIQGLDCWTVAEDSTGNPDFLKTEIVIQ